MPKRLSLLLFPAAFVLTLWLVLAAVLEAYLFVESGATEFQAGIVTRLRAELVVSGIFLVMSGFAPIFLAAYFLATRKWSQLSRVKFNSTLFVGCYVFFSIIMGHEFSWAWLALLMAGGIGVLISEALGWALAGRTRTLRPR